MMIRKNLLNTILNLLGFFFFFRENKSEISSFINLNNEKSNVSFITMKKMSNTRLLSNAVLVNLSVSHHSVCMSKCAKTQNCTSYNMFTDSQDTLQCQLLSENKYAYPNLLESKIGWVHASIQSIPCEKSVCKNNGICIPIYKENSFLCNCSTKYLGPTCKTELLALVSLPLANLGCWKDAFDRAVATLENSTLILNVSCNKRTHAIELCYEAAEERGFTTFALQNGCCYASNDITYNIYGLSKECDNDGKGGLWANQVYKIIEKLPYSYAGCWQDNWASRIASELEGSNAILDQNPFYSYPFQNRVNAIRKCHIAASKKKYNFFGIEYTGQCFGGNGVSYKIHGPVVNCNFDGIGGWLIMDVYLIN